jgi:hypothetical protein
MLGSNFMARPPAACGLIKISEDMLVFSDIARLNPKTTRAWCFPQSGAL